MLREAEPLKREALAGCREVLGNRHPHTLASIANLADMLMQLGNADPRALDEAEPLCREAPLAAPPACVSAACPLLSLHGVPPDVAQALSGSR